MQVVDFRPEHAAAWRDLNTAWIEKHFALEPADHAVLDDPQGQIIDKGGAVFMVLDDENVLGCCGLKAMADGGFEVVKMTTAESARGKGAGRLLMQACVERAQALGASRLYLETNSALGPALALYRRFGFEDLPARPTPYARADVFMQLLL